MRRVLAGMLLVACGGLAGAAGQPPTSPKKGVGKSDPPDEKLDKESAALVKQLKSPDVKVRLKAVDTIAQKGEGGVALAGPLCDSVLDPSPKVATAAIQAVEKVCPDLYKPLTALIVDRIPENRLRGAKELGLLGEKAAPATNVVLTVLRQELAKGPDRFSRGNLTVMQSELFNAVRQINPDDLNTVKIYKAIAGPSNRYSAARVEAITFLHHWAGVDEARRKEVLPLVGGGLPDPVCQLPCIKYLGEYGAMAKGYVPQLKQLKLSATAAVRDAATVSLDLIENQ